MHPTKAIGEDWAHICVCQSFRSPTYCNSQLSGYETNTCAFLSNNSEQKK